MRHGSASPGWRKSMPSVLGRSRPRPGMHLTKVTGLSGRSSSTLAQRGTPNRSATCEAGRSSQREPVASRPQAYTEAQQGQRYGLANNGKVATDACPDTARGFPISVAHDREVRNDLLVRPFVGITLRPAFHHGADQPEAVIAFRIQIYHQRGVAEPGHAITGAGFAQ